MNFPIDYTFIPYLDWRQIIINKMSNKSDAISNIDYYLYIIFIVILLWYK